MYYSVEYLTGRNDDLILIFSFVLWHIFVYSLNKIYDIKEDTVLDKNPIKSNELNYFILISIFLFIIPLVLLIYFGYDIKPYLILVIVGYSYSASPFGTDRRIKNIYILKNIYAAFWTIAVPCILVIHYMDYTIDEKLTQYFSYYFILLLSIEIISDLPDIKGDAMMGVNTMAVKLGYNFTKYVSLVLLGGLVVYSSLLEKYYMIVIPSYIFVLLYFSNENSIKRNIGFIFYGYLLLVLIFSFLGWAF